MGWGHGSTGNLSTLITSRITTRMPPAENFGTDLFLPQLEGKHLLITRSGSRFSDVFQEPEENLGLFRFERGGSSVSLLWGAGPPSSELPTHMFLYAHKTRSINSILHCHLDEVPRIDPIMEGQSRELPDWVTWVQDIPFGTVELAQVTLQEIGERDTVYWKEHGVLTASSDLESALNAMKRFSEWARSLQ